MTLVFFFFFLPHSFSSFSTMHPPPSLPTGNTEALEALNQCLYKHGRKLGHPGDNYTEDQIFQSSLQAHIQLCTWFMARLQEAKSQHEAINMAGGNTNDIDAMFVLYLDTIHAVRQLAKRRTRC